MAKANAVYAYPSVFGSHKSMISAETIEEGKIVCKDEFGEYLTEKWRLDSGLADPNRYAEKRLTSLFNKKKEEK